MKRQLLSIAALLSAASAIAQPTIQANQFNYTSLSAFEYKYASSQQTAIAQPGASGANVSWDFSNIVAQSTINYATAACPGDADCGLFAGANQVVKLNNVGGAKVYYNKTQNMMEQVGEKGMGADGDAVFSNPMKVMQFPVSFGQTFSDSYSYGTSSGTRSGTLTSTIDAYGTLKTPAGTYTNVLRQKIVENSTVTVGSQSMQILITHYYWLAPNVHRMLMSLISTQTEIVGIPPQTVYVATYSTQSSTPTVLLITKACLVKLQYILTLPAKRSRFKLPAWI
ncbi:MAG: hypothetical protein WC756_08145 [Taibaiella sp.]|jgi:hypothetical protein